MYFISMAYTCRQWSAHTSLQTYALPRSTRRSPSILLNFAAQADVFRLWDMDILLLYRCVRTHENIFDEAMMYEGCSTLLQKRGITNRISVRARTNIYQVLFWITATIGLSLSLAVLQFSCRHR